ncbi:MAG: hypothetical protein PHQ74_10655 [Crocinitomicaceae bacterium]|nr:hypothetical protein [Crocinitomicaceae bacterium]
MSPTLKMLLLATILFSKNLVAQDYDVKKLQKLLDKEMIFQKSENEITFETINPVSISDFEKFQSDVRDSVAIETVFFSRDDDEKTLLYLRSYKKSKVEPYDREFNRSLYPLKRNVKNLYTAYSHVPLLHFMRIPRDLNPLFNTIISFDDRNVYYETNSKKTFKYSDTLISKTAYPIFHNHWILADLSNVKHDIPDVLAQVLPILFKDKAPYNLTENQYEAYLDWKFKKMNVELKKMKIDGQLEIIPLFQVDTFQFVVKGEELYSQWNIQKTEYEKFVKYTNDSLVRETLFFELRDLKKSNKFIRHPQEYFDENGLEYVDFEPVDKVVNRMLFNLDYKTKIHTEDPEIKEILIKMESQHRGSLMYCYRTLDLKNSIFKKSDRKLHSPRYQRWFQIDTSKVEILPIKSADSVENFSKLLNYKQAIAFYNWKYPISKSTSDSNWKNYVFPTKEEFLKLQSMSGNDFPDKTFSYSTRTMKYRVRLGL